MNKSVQESRDEWTKSRIGPKNRERTGCCRGEGAFLLLNVIVLFHTLRPARRKTRAKKKTGKSVVSVR